MSSPKPKTSLHERCLLLLEIIPILKVFSVLILTSFQELSTQETIILKLVSVLNVLFGKK